MQHQDHQDHQGASGPTTELDAIGRQIVDSAIKVHRILGPGLLESAYEHCLAHELHSRRLEVVRQAPLPIEYDGLRLNAGYRLDLVVEGAVLVEIKAVETLSRLHEAQILTYLKLSGYRLGYLMNFNAIQLKQGLRRYAR